MNRSLIFAAAIAPAFVFGAPVAAQPAPDAPERRLTIRGEGEAAATPDLVTVRIGVETEAETAAEAMTANSEQAAKVIEAAKARGVAPRDVQTSGLSIRPVYQNREPGEAGAPRIVGYGVGNIVTVRLRDVAAAGEAIGALVEAGANRLDGVSFGFADDSDLKNEARRAAVADALAKAELYAGAAGVALGPILSIEESGDRVQPHPQMRAMAAEAAPLEAGESAIGAGVVIIWALEDFD